MLSLHIYIYIILNTSITLIYYILFMYNNKTSICTIIKILINECINVNL